MSSKLVVSTALLFVIAFAYPTNALDAGPLGAEVPVESEVKASGPSESPKSEKPAANTEATPSSTGSEDEPIESEPNKSEGQKAPTQEAVPQAPLDPKPAPEAKEPALHDEVDTHKAEHKKDAKAGGHHDDEKKIDVEDALANAPAPQADKQALAHYVTYHEQQAPLFFTRDGGGNTANDRARIAGTRFGAALEKGAESSSDDATKATVTVDDDKATVRIGDTVIATLSTDDAKDAGYELKEYASALEVPLNAFIEDQLRRKSQQNFFLHFFISVFVMVLAFLTLGMLRRLFDRVDEFLDEKRGTLKPISILRVDVFSGDALSGALALAASVGRVVAYVVTFIATFAFVFSQFDYTRPLVGRLGKWSAGPIVSAVEGVISAIPGLLLAILIFILIRVGLRVLNLLLDGVQSKRIQWNQLPPERVPTFRFVATVGTLVICAPLMVAAVFGGFNTPLETLALGVGGVILVAAIPSVSNYVIGIIWIWRNTLSPGDWVEVGRYSGEVTKINFHEVRLVPEGGGIISVPALYLLSRPIRRLRGNPQLFVDLTVARDRPASELIAAMRKAVEAIDSDAVVECIDLCHAWLKMRISAPAIRPQLREQILVALSDAVDRHEFELPTLHGGAPENRVQAAKDGGVT